jgi:hypothetical protein
VDQDAGCQSIAVWIPFVGATVTGRDDVPVLKTNAGVRTRPEIAVASVTGMPDEFDGQGESIALCDPSGESDVLAGEVVVAGPGSLSCEGLQPSDALSGDLFLHQTWGEEGEWGDSGANEGEERKFPRCPASLLTPETDIYFSVSISYVEPQ